MEVINTLRDQQVLTPEMAEAVSAAVSSGTGLEQALKEVQVPTDTIRDTLAAFYGIPAFKPDTNQKITEDVLKYIPVGAAQNYEAVPITIEDDTLIVGVNEPEDLRLQEALSFISTKYSIPYKFVFVLEEDLEQLLAAYDNLSGEVDRALTSLEQELDQEIAERRSESSGEDISAEHIKEDAPVTKIVATILRYAVDGNASDIHIQPTDSNVAVRFRVDGLLATSLQLPRNVHAAVVARIKILSSMRLDERRKPQDGRFSATFDGRKIDFRVSIFPTNHGEKVVMRILDNESGVRSLEDTGMSKHHLKTIRRMIQEPYGIILISGPTGSGKSTTLYAMLSEVDRQTKNVLSLEDPIEYNIEGVSQSQMRPEIGYTFANGLRTALRQDPDVILVGEIRDAETAQLAIQAALTGHLVLSTIHTNNAIGVVPRLIDMGIDPYLIAPTLKLAIAQRLARRLCPGTGREEKVPASMQMMFDKEFETLPESYRDRIPEQKTVFHPEPSPECATGTKGRVAVMEVLEVDQDIQELILSGGSEEDMYHAARAQGFMSMKEDAIIKALEGTIPYEEVSAFGTKVGEENVLTESARPVDNPAPETPDTV
jgi:type IV pilus assembly protein PilB